MDKELIKILIKENQQKIMRISFVERIVDIEPNFNYIFVGLRRVGKTYLMYQQIHSLIKKGHSIEEILFFNFEDDRIDKIELQDLDKIKKCYEEIYDHKPIFFLDEIQVVDHWEKFARRLADDKYSVYISGSNAKMLSKEIATTLGGRFLMQNVFPFSFCEYLLAKKIDIDVKNIIYEKYYEIIKLFENYFSDGGIPESIAADDKRAYLSSLYQKIYLGDIYSRYQIRNDAALNFLVKKLAENLKQPTSYTRLANIISSLGTKVATATIIEYVNYIKDSWLVFSLENLNSRFVERETNKKYYFTDNGLLNLFLIDPNTSLLENLVAIQLHKKYKNEVYYYHNGVEVDFVVPDEKLAVQAAYSLADFDTRKREITALEKLAKQMELDKMLIITKDEEETITGQDIDIQVIPIWKWLLEE